MNPKDAALLPLELVKQYTRQYPTIWELTKKLRDIPNPKWDTRGCYLPISAGIAIMQHLSMPYNAVFMVPALAAWRQSKEVYTFDQDLADALYSQAADTKIPCDVLMHLPFYCVYIDSGKYRFFVHLENDVNDGRWELRFARILDDGKPSASYLHLGDYTISESILAGLDESARQMERAEKDESFQALLDYAQNQEPEYHILDQEALSEMLQLVLYICADNADVTQPEENQKTYRPRQSGEPIDKYREVRKWDAGYYVGNALRKQRSEDADSVQQPYKGGTKRPHMRRGHWHHYWKGSQGNRELVLHWVLPIFVNGDDSDDESPARITPVK